MSFIKNCSNCHASHSELTPLYFCCESQRLFCRRCRPSLCAVCRRSGWREARESACKICKRKLEENQGLREQICGELYCPRCVAHLYLPYYLSKEAALIVELRCGHFKDRLEIEAVLVDYCISCGFRFREGADYELQDQMKLCSFCFGYQGRKFEDFLQRCLNCCKILKSREGVLCFDLLLCKGCSESQTMIEQSIVHSNLAQGKQPSAISQMRSERLAPYKEKMEEEPSEQLSIVSRFSAFQIDQEEKKSKKGKVSTMRILSKNSVQIRVENFQLPSIEDTPAKLIRCELCSCFIPINGTLTNTTHSNTRICKICYTQTFDKSYITFTRYNNYTSSEQRTTSLPKNSQPLKNAMKLSMLPQGSAQKETQPARQLFQPTVAPRVERKEAWELQGQRNLCELCNLRSVMIIRADKKRVCVQCRNRHG